MQNDVIFGKHAIEQLLSKDEVIISQIYYNKERLNKRIDHLIALATQKSIKVSALSNKTFVEKFPHTADESIVGLIFKRLEWHENDIDNLLSKTKKPLILVLDGITDVHNLGASLRVADGAGVDFVIIPKDKNASINAIVHKISAGASLSVPLIRVTNLVRVLEKLKKAGVWLFGAALDGTNNLFDLDLTHPCALILGAEDKGMRRLTAEQCDYLFTIPMKGSVSSLNVSVAAGISLYEILRQRYVNP